jgi:hypothetical protein
MRVTDIHLNIANFSLNRPKQGTSLANAPCVARKVLTVGCTFNSTLLSAFFVGISMQVVVMDVLGSVLTGCVDIPSTV